MATIRPCRSMDTLAASDREAPAWAELIEGALDADWEAVDRELRQLLSGLGASG